MIISLAVVQALHLGVRVSEQNRNRKDMTMCLLQLDQTVQYHNSPDEKFSCNSAFKQSGSNFNEPEKQAVRINMQLFAKITWLRSDQINQLFGKYDEDLVW